MNVEENNYNMRQKRSGNYRQNGCQRSLTTNDSNFNYQPLPIYLNHPYTTMIPYPHRFSQSNELYCQDSISNSNSKFTVRNQNMIVGEQRPDLGRLRQVTQNDDDYSLMNFNLKQHYFVQTGQLQQQYYMHGKQRSPYFMGDQQHSKEISQFYLKDAEYIMNDKQKNHGSVHFESDQGMKQIYQPFKQGKSQKTAIELLIKQLKEANSGMDFFIQNHDTYKNHYNKQLKVQQLIQQGVLIEGMVDQNYKLYQIVDENQLRQSYHGNKRFEEMFGLFTNIGNKWSQSQGQVGDNYNQAVIIDYQQQLDKILNISNHYLNSTIPSNSYPHQQLKTYTITYSIDLFVKLVLEISDFYRLIFLFQQSQLLYTSMPSLGSNPFQKNLQNQSIGCGLPLLVRSILWHLNAFRVLVWVYQYQMKNLIAISHTRLQINIRQSNSSSQLTTIKSRSVTILQSLQELLATFLQQIMLHSQSNSNSSTKQHQVLQFFYYQYAQFNQQWVCLLLDTLLKAQMVIGLGWESLLHLITINKLTPYIINQLPSKSNPLNHTHFSPANNLNSDAKNHKSKKLTNPSIESNHNIRYKKDQNLCRNKSKTNDNDNNNESSNETCLPQQTINNMLSIISLLLFPQQNYPSNNSNPSLSTSAVNNPICQLLQQPMRKMILKQMKIFQRKLQSYEHNGEQINSQDRKTLVITKILLINKITNLISFFTSKLTESKVNNKNDDLKNKKKIIHKRNNKDIQKKQALKDNNLNEFTIQLIDQEEHQTDQSKQGVFSAELKIMQMTLFVRQMCDILMLDGLETCSIQDIEQERVFYYGNQWVKELSMKSMIGMLFEKVLRRKGV